MISFHSREWVSSSSSLELFLVRPDPMTTGCRERWKGREVRMQGTPSWCAFPRMAGLNSCPSTPEQSASSTSVKSVSECGSQVADPWPAAQLRKWFSTSQGSTHNQTTNKDKPTSPWKPLWNRFPLKDARSQTAIPYLANDIFLERN